jgi:protein-S-isoprenylcysteine O-methyltransferase Ste14
MIQTLRIQVSRLFGILMAVMLCISTSGWEEQAPLMAAGLFFLGTILVGLATVGRLWCSLYIAGYKTKHLVTVGPYSMSRNPLYLFSLLGAVGVGLATRTFLFPLVLLTAFILYYPFVINIDEAELTRLHESEFSAYRKAVPRFFPKISLLEEPKEYVVKPLVFRKNILDVIWFVWALGFLPVINGLQKVEVLPVIFKIY